jgi:flagellar biosynthesis anti-sigma factor FlgM
MKISKRSVSSTYQSSSSSKAGNAYSKVQGPTDAARSGDSIEVSESAGLFQKAVDAVSDVPDIRMEAIEGIQRELEDGSYHRDESEVAERVISDYLESPLP